MSKKFLLLAVCFSLGITYLNAQVTIGANSAPQPFSLLELDASFVKSGLRLPQLASFDRDDLPDLINPLAGWVINF